MKAPPSSPCQTKYEVGVVVVVGVIASDEATRDSVRMSWLSAVAEGRQTNTAGCISFLGFLRSLDAMRSKGAFVGLTHEVV